MRGESIGWLGIFRLGLVQTALGAIVVLTTSTLNRVMVVELALPAMLPGALVTMHYALQMLRPRMGYGSDMGQRRTPWIIGGMGVLALGGIGAAMATAVMATQLVLGTVLAVLSFTMIGAGVSAAGTSLLVLLAKRVDERRRAAAATIVWIMMIAGFAITATIAGKLLDPFSLVRMIAVTAGVSVAAFLLTLVAIRGVEGHPVANAAVQAGQSRPNFVAALKEVWSESDARHFTIFVFVSMLAYSAQDLVLEPFAGAIFAFTPGESTKLSGVQHGGVLAGMILVAFAGSVFGGRQYGSLKAWMVGGCIASAIAHLGLVCAGVLGRPWPLTENVLLLGMANGAFSIAAIGSMMAMANRGRESREGVRMGLWGASQAIAFGAGGFLGTVISDLAGFSFDSRGAAYSVVFGLEALAFIAAAWLAVGIGKTVSRRSGPATRDATHSTCAPALQAAKGGD